MNLFNEVITMNAETIAIILAILLGVSESLAVIPVVKSNSIYQLIVNVLKALAPKK